MTHPVLQVDALSVSLPRGADRTKAVSDVSFAVRSGQLMCLVGESGSGKSMIAHTVMGLLPRNVRATSGRVLLTGEDILEGTPRRLRELRGQQMSMIFQEPMTALSPVMRCGRQIDELLVQHCNLSSGDRRKRVLKMLEHVRLPDAERIYSSYPHQLSGGQRQRIMIAMALILKPALLIADEPTTALDVTTQADILRLIRDLQRENNTAVLFITHDFGVVAEIADTVVVIKDGEVVESGLPSNVLSQPCHAYTRMLLAAVPGFKPRKLQLGSDARVKLHAKGLTRIFDSGGWLRQSRRVIAADAVDLEVYKGETLGIVGESGSGKSTVARLLSRLITPSGGEIELDSLNVTRLRGAAALEFRRKVQVVFQDPYRSLNPRRTVGAAISEGPINFGASQAKARERSAELMKLVQLSPNSLNRYPHEFSGGQRQRICIARALAVGPEVIIADEAVSALDVSVQEQILALFEEIQQRLHLTLIFITHDLRVAAQICNRVVVMQQGRVVEQGPATQIFQNPRHEYTRALLASAPGRDFEFGMKESHSIFEPR